jgi:hypothetical protein
MSTEKINLGAFIPVNFNAPNKIIFGLFDSKKLLQALLVAGILEGIVLLLPLIVPVKIALSIIPLSILVFGIIGYEGLSLFDIFSAIFSYRKSAKAYSMQRVSTTYTGRARKMNRRRTEVGRGKIDG